MGPDYKPELFVRKIDEKAKWVPNNTAIRIPTDPCEASWETAGYRSVTWLQYANSVNKIAHWLDATFGKSIDNDTFAYFGPSDVRYAFVFAALNKSNRKFLVPDGRIKKENLESLLKTIDCKVWLFDEGATFESGAMAGLGEIGVKMHQLPTLAWCLDAEGTPPYPYEKTYEDAKNDEIIVIHTSGTTGPPKPIVMNNGFWAAGASYAALARRNWPRGISTDSYFGRSLILACSMRWLAGLIMTNSFAIFYNTVVILPPPHLVSVPPDAFEKLLRLNYEVDGLMGFPFTVTDLYKDERTRESLKSLEFITYLGAALDREVGDALCEHTRLGSVMGATESGGRFSLHPIDRKLWYTFQFIPEHHVRLARVHGSGVASGGSDEDDTYQLYIDRPPGGGPSEFQCAFWNFRMYSDVESIDVEELWKPVKDADGSTRWEFAGRADDWVKLTWAAKFHATALEALICQYPGIRRVMIGGTGRPAPYALIELEDEVGEQDQQKLLDDIYQKTIVGVNETTSEMIGIPRETMCLAKKEKPFKLGLKKLVLRKEVEQEYLEEIEKLYEHLEAKWKAQGTDHKTKYHKNMN